MRLSELIRKAMEARLADVRVALPGRIENYDVEAQTADVKPLIKQVTDAEDGKIVESLPVIPAVPVCQPRSGGFCVSLPIAKGDTGLLIVCDRSIDQWHKLGGEVDPRDMRMHSLNGAVFYPGLTDSTRPLASASAEDLVIGDDDGDALLTLKDDGSILIGRGAAAEAARKGDSVEAVIPAGTVVVGVSGGSGAAAVGTTNVSDITLNGKITGGSDAVKIK
jgi:hypothetical protein